MKAYVTSRRRGGICRHLGGRVCRYRGTGVEGGGDGGIRRCQVRADLSRRHVPLIEEDRGSGRPDISCQRGERAEDGARPVEGLGRAGLWPSAGLYRKTQLRSRPTRTCAARQRGHVVSVREVRLSAGAGFVVVITGEIMTMPGLPKSPAAERIHLNRRKRDRSCSDLPPGLRPLGFKFVVGKPLTCLDFHRQWR